MSTLLERDAEALHRALAKSGAEMNVALSRETVELMSRLIDARARGEEIVVSPGNAEVTPTEAAVLLGMSRPQVRKLMKQDLLAFRKVGTHHRIRVSTIRAFLEAERLASTRGASRSGCPAKRTRPDRMNEMDDEVDLIRVVLADANVLYSRVLRDYLLYAADQEIIAITWSPEILAEVTEHLQQNVVGFDDAAAARLVGAMNAAFPLAEVRPSDSPPSAHYAEQVRRRPQG